ncbi:hypothetical protein CC1G_11899 [Coprinopsis cinerea okayama7|uniref:Uncharacterized protein n=1 Tax=Coprinopsis cinerea (strain Okayama-7 / 130 / ATCC MYA-4618 / FGSC 9003) TaxID=240176 RepID=A8NDB1_COPC7|nr:hypothetical protein CC1G_11899 [Coprinopsis cinerea okayama7\|eukprot:XP_001832735.2 hypothetical protein CC1G_11899 [Coprinopsis cinerea okayama7\
MSSAAQSGTAGLHFRRRRGFRWDYATFGGTTVPLSAPSEESVGTVGSGSVEDGVGGLVPPSVLSAPDSSETGSQTPTSMTGVGVSLSAHQQPSVQTTSPAVPDSDLLVADAIDSLPGPLGAENSDEDEEPRCPLTLEITANKVARWISIIVLGSLGGWSLFPSEDRIPTSMRWVLCVAFLVNSVVCMASLDTLYPPAVSWYFRKSLNRSRLLKGGGSTAGADPDPILVKLRGYEIVNAGLVLVYLAFKYWKREDNTALAWVDIAHGLVAGAVLYQVNQIQWPTGWKRFNRWMFKKNFAKLAINILSVIYGLSTWWWTYLRIIGVIKVIRQRRDPSVRPQFLILMAGMVLEATAILLFVFSAVVWRFIEKLGDNGVLVRLGREVGVRRRLGELDEIWYSHFVPMVAVAYGWVVVMMAGFWDGVPMGFVIPCSQGGWVVCEKLARYV